jgi:plastocyanin
MGRSVGMRTRLLKILVLVVAVGLVASACSKKSNPPASGTTTTESTPGSEVTTTESEGTMTIGSDEANDHGTQTVSGGSIDVEVDNFYFEPTVIKGAAGAQVTLTIKNDSTTLHNFSLQDQGIDQDIQPDATQSVTVTIPQTGFVEFFCKYHKGSGMVGELATA